MSANILKRISNLFDYIPIYLSEVSNLKAAQKTGTAEALIEYLGRSRLSGMTQKTSEVLRFLSILKILSPRIVVEIGTGKGGTLLLWAFASDESAKIITIDLHKGAFGGGYRKSQEWLYRKFRRHGQHIYFLNGDSHDLEVNKKVIKLLHGKQIDFLFIDGDHSIEGVTQDFQMYGNLVRTGGIVAFHDIVPDKPEIVGGVPYYWNELKQQMACHEIVEDANQGGYGIGWFEKAS